MILTELKTKAAHRNVPLPDNLLECLKEAKKISTSDYVVANRDGDPLSYTQFKRLWQYIVTRTTKERCYYRYEDGKRVKHTVKPVLGQKAAHNGNVVYCLDFEVTPHQLRHTYITNLIHASVDPKTVQYTIQHKDTLALRSVAKKTFDDYKKENGSDKKLPRISELNAEYAMLLERKKSSYAEYRKTKSEMQDWLVAQKIAFVSRKPCLQKSGF